MPCGGGRLPAASADRRQGSSERLAERDKRPFMQLLWTGGIRASEGPNMSTQPIPVSDLLVPANFIQAVRESGYLSLSTALAELVDNSLQARATEIAVDVTRDSPTALPQIVVEDNGVGMNRRELEDCLRFGGSARFDERSSFGRFGMGLPAASLSQSRRVEVAAWRKNGRVLQVALDVDEILAGLPVTLAARVVGSPDSPSGCRVTWRSCDRIDYRRLGWLERTLRRDLGRMYRRHLQSGLLLTLNGITVEPEDPLMLDRRFEGTTASLVFDQRIYELATSSGGTSQVKVRFAMLPVHRWHSLDNVSKRRIGIVGGGGVSVLRAGREIAHGWYLMGSKRKENYDDWWRCEIEFEPALDEHFGITINKQGIRPSAELRDALAPELESIARILNARVRQAFEDVKFQAAAAASCLVAESADPDLPVLHETGGTGRSLRYCIGTAQLSTGSMFSTRVHDGTLEVQLNVDHPAFAAIYQPLQALPDEVGSGLRTAIELLVLALGRSAAADPESSHAFIDQLSETYGRMLQKT